MILTDSGGRPIEKPSHTDFADITDYIRAFHAYKDRIAAVANAAFDRGLEEELAMKEAIGCTCQGWRDSRHCPCHGEGANNE